MARDDVRLSSRGIELLLASDQVRPPLRAAAEQIAARARASAPVDTGAYRDGIGVESGHSRIDGRAVEMVVSRDRKTPIVEAKTGNLKRALGG